MLLLVVAALIVGVAVSALEDHVVLTLPIALVDVHAVHVHSIPSRLALVMVCISDEVRVPVVLLLSPTRMLIRSSSRRQRSTSGHLTIFAHRMLPLPRIEIFVITTARHVPQAIPLRLHPHDLLSL